MPKQKPKPITDDELRMYQAGTRSWWSHKDKERLVHELVRLRARVKELEDGR